MLQISLYSKDNLPIQEGTYFSEAEVFSLMYVCNKFSSTIFFRINSSNAFSVLWKV